MAQNTLPSGINDLFLLARRIRDGLALHGPWLQLHPVANFADFLARAGESESAFAVARARKASAARRFAAADEALTAWLAKARMVVMLARGGEWSEAWLEAGFTHRATNVPKRIGPRIELARRLAEFLGKNPEYEVPFAGVTAAEAHAMHGEITAAESAVRATALEAAEKKRARDKAEKELRRQMRCVVLFLYATIAKSDPRWLAFGLNLPNPAAPRSRSGLAHCAEPATVEMLLPLLAPAPLEAAVAA